MSKGKTNNKQEMQANADSCTNKKRDAINKQDANIQKDQDMPINPINYFTSSSNIDADKRKSIEMTQIIYNKFGDVFNGIGCFKGTFSLQLKPNSRPYQAPPRHVEYVLQKPFKEELDGREECDEEYIGESSRTFGERFKEYQKALSPIFDHFNTTGHNISVENFNIVGREDQNLR